MKLRIQSAIINSILFAQFALDPAFAAPGTSNEDRDSSSSTNEQKKSYGFYGSEADDEDKIRHRIYGIKEPVEIEYLPDHDEAFQIQNGFAFFPPSAKNGNYLRQMERQNGGTKTKGSAGSGNTDGDIANGQDSGSASVAAQDNGGGKFRKAKSTKSGGKSTKSTGGKSANKAGGNAKTSANKAGGKGKTGKGKGKTGNPKGKNANKGKSANKGKTAKSKAGNGSGGGTESGTIGGGGGGSSKGSKSTKNSGGSPAVPAVTASPSASARPSDIPSDIPSLSPSESPSLQPTTKPSAAPSLIPSQSPSDQPSESPSVSIQPSAAPSMLPSLSPSDVPSVGPSSNPSSTPSLRPSAGPSSGPSAVPSATPSLTPSQAPSDQPSESPSLSNQPSDAPSMLPSSSPSDEPSVGPSTNPSSAPSLPPSAGPSSIPSAEPSDTPSDVPTMTPSDMPSLAPSASMQPSVSPSQSGQPSSTPTSVPSSAPSMMPSGAPSVMPTGAPSTTPSGAPTEQCDRSAFLAAINCAGGDQGCIDLKAAIETDPGLTNFFACKGDNVADSVAAFNVAAGNAALVDRFEAAASAVTNSNIQFFTGDGDYLTSVCASTPGATCCDDTDSCYIDGIVTIASNSCRGTDACKYLAYYAIVFEDSCIGPDACELLNSAYQRTSQETYVYAGSCKGDQACESLGYDGYSEVRILANSCVGEGACGKAGVRSDGVNAGSAASILDESPIRIGPNSCNEKFACYGLNAFDTADTTYTFKTKGAITVQQNACVGDYSCYAAMYTNLIDADLLVETSQCNGVVAYYTDTTICANCAQSYVCLAGQTLPLSDPICPAPDINGGDCTGTADP